MLYIGRSNSKTVYVIFIKNHRGKIIQITEENKFQT